MSILTPAEFNASAQREEWQQTCDPTLGFEHSDFAAVVALWKAQARDRDMPARSDMTARVLKEFLPRVAMKERVETNPSRYLWRLVGTKVAEVLGVGRRVGVEFRVVQFGSHDAPRLSFCSK